MMDERWYTEIDMVICNIMYHKDEHRSWETERIIVWCTCLTGRKRKGESTMKKRRYLLAILIMLIGIFAIPLTARAGEKDGWRTDYTNYEKDSTGKLVSVVYWDDTTDEAPWYYYFNADSAAASGVENVVFSSSNKAVCTITSSTAKVNIQNTWWPSSISTELKIKKCGISVITARTGDKKYSFTLVVTPKNWTPITAVRTTGYNTIKLRWKKTAGATGYVILRGKVADSGSKVRIIKRIDSAATVSATVKAVPGLNCGYIVVPVVKTGGKVYGSIPESAYFWNDGTMITYAHTYSGAKITKLAVSGSKVTINWAADKNVKNYKIYYKTREEASWNLLHTVKKAAQTSYTRKMTPGYNYTFRVVYNFPGYSFGSGGRSCYLTRKASVVKKKTNIKQSIREGQYNEYGAEWNWADSEETFYYEKNKTLHVVARDGQKLIDYAMTSTGGVKSKKTVKLGKFDYWGGFYYGPDGCYYVAIGYSNGSSSKTKTVIKILKYSASWKLQKTCAIRGGESNMFDGIITPFDAGNCRMMMNGKKLYLFTCRIMFSGHQSNIAFIINTKTMKYRTVNYDYTSHSFNQFLKFDGDTLFLSNHGDAYSRGVNITKVTNFDTSNADTTSRLPFMIKGEIGDNYTGLCEGGMETTAGSVLIAGTSVPQKYKVSGVSGNGSNLAKNVFVIVINKKTMKSSIKWITTNNPKTTKVKVGETRLVKISDDYVALMYTSTLGSKTVLNYVVLDANGKVVCKKKYSGMTFSASTQPILFQGSIVWTDVKEIRKKKTDSWGWTYYDIGYVPYYYSIPVVTGK